MSDSPFTAQIVARRMIEGRPIARRHQLVLAEQFVRLETELAEAYRLLEARAGALKFQRRAHHAWKERAEAAEEAVAAIRRLPSEHDLLTNAVARAMWEYARRSKESGRPGPPTGRGTE